MTGTIDLTNLLLSGLAGSIAGAVFPGIALLREGRTNTLRMISEFDSIEWYRSRAKAFALTEKHPNKQYNEADFNASEGADELWAMVNYYRTISLLVEGGAWWKPSSWWQVQSDPLVRGVGQTFVWWYFVAFKPNLIGMQDDWDVKRSIQSLYEWIAKNARNDDFARWQAAGEAERERIAPSRTTPPSQLDTSNIQSQVV
ncbi:hypothetical protein ELG67_09790 [Rhizobium leguminosarum]|uniref:hypothetical protein n=1 Tax=Rhizobium leguminosarum TaxID=384 RepID=UPI001037AE01|nr:hypothetical protein [Rhizobium leguminosarum]TBG89360.1 hypothetical protein ELG67_09790 [Rhizobium leguminosarum]